MGTASPQGASAKELSDAEVMESELVLVSSKAAAMHRVCAAMQHVFTAHDEDREVGAGDDPMEQLQQLAGGVVRAASSALQRLPRLMEAAADAAQCNEMLLAELESWQW